MIYLKKLNQKLSIRKYNLNKKINLLLNFKNKENYLYDIYFKKTTQN